jgi:hypothetical protein
MRTTQFREPFDEDLLSTGVLLAEKASQVNDEMNETTGRWKIVQRPTISALYPRGTGPARGT